MKHRIARNKKLAKYFIPPLSIGKIVHDGRTFVRYDYHRQGDLSEFLRRNENTNGITDQKCLVAWARHLAAGLALLHDHEKIVFGDLNPKNILLVEEASSRELLPHFTDYGGIREEGMEASPLYLTTMRRFQGPEYVGAHCSFNFLAVLQHDIYALGQVFQVMSAGLDGPNFPEATDLLAPVIGPMLADDTDRRPSAAEVRLQLDQLYYDEFSNITSIRLIGR